MNLDVNGLDELMSRVRKMSNTEAVEEKALEAGAAEMKSILESVAPVKTGTLKANIIKSSIENGSVKIGTRPTGDGFYGFFLEFGTSKMSARPWVRPAFEQNKESIKSIMAAELRRGLNL